MKIGILVAMDSEVESLLNIIKYPLTISLANNIDCHYGILDKNEIYLVKTGIGKVNAALSSTLLIEKYDPDLIISTGCAGGIRNLEVFDIALGTDYKYHDVWCPLDKDTRRGEIQGMPFEYYWNHNTIYDIEKLSEHYYKQVYRLSHFYTGDQFIQTKKECDKILSYFGEDLDVSGICCDMESAAIAQVCRIFNTDFIGIRIISDTPYKFDSPDDHFKSYNNFWSNISNKLSEFTIKFLECLK